MSLMSFSMPIENHAMQRTEPLILGVLAPSVFAAYQIAATVFSPVGSPALPVSNLGQTSHHLTTLWWPDSHPASDPASRSEASISDTGHEPRFRAYPQCNGCPVAGFAVRFSSGVRCTNHRLSPHSRTTRCSGRAADPWRSQPSRSSSPISIAARLLAFSA